MQCLLTFQHISVIHVALRIHSKTPIFIVKIDIYGRLFR